MIFQSTRIDGLWTIVIERHRDERGSFGRTFCEKEFTERGLDGRFVQSSTSVTRRAGTLRGMHYQRPPYEEVKLVRCVRGTIFDVVADVRPDSPSFGAWQGFRLGQDEDLSLYIPTGCAHGFLTLTDDVEVTYSMSTPFAPGFADGFRYDDPVFAIEWPAAPGLVAEKDLAWGPFQAGA